MPTVLHEGPYSFVFFSSDKSEPPHVHVKRERRIAKFWLQDVRIENNHGFRPHELNEIERQVSKHRDFLKEAWREYFGA